MELLLCREEGFVGFVVKCNISENSSNDEGSDAFDGGIDSN